MVVESAEMGLKTVIKVCRQEEKNKFGSLKLVLLIKITFHVNRKFLILVFRLLTGLSTIFLHLSTGLSTVVVRRPTPNPSTRGIYALFFEARTALKTQMPLLFVLK